MSIAYLENKLQTLEKFKFFVDLIGRFADSKKQMSHIRKIIFLEFDFIESDSFRLEENDNRSVEYYVSEIKDIVTRFKKAKKVDDYNRAGELLKRCTLEIAEAIKSTEAAMIDAKEKAEMETVAVGISIIGDMPHIAAKHLGITASDIAAYAEKVENGGESS